MGSWASLLSPNSALTYLLVLLLPSIPSLIGRYRRWRAPTPPHLRQAPAPRRPLRLYLILAIHTLYRIQQLLVPPFNVFTHFHLPITANRDYLQASLWRYHSTLSGLSGRAAHYDPNQLPSNILRLSNRLSNIDYRLLYARYGHEALEGCTWCSSQADFAVVSLPGIVGPYVGVAVLLGLLGWASVGGAGAAGRADRMRGKAGWGLVVAALGEVGVRYMWELRVVEGDCLQLDATCITLRSIALLLIPLIYTFLPLGPTSSHRLLELLPRLHTTSNTVRLTALARSAVSADPTLRDQAASVGRQAEAQRSVARADEWVQQAAARQGLAYGLEAPVRADARRWVGEQWREKVRIEPGPHPAPL